MVAVVVAAPPRRDIGGAWDVIDDDGFFATDGVRVVASRDRRGGWRVARVVVVARVARWWSHGIVGAGCVDVVVKDSRTTRLDKKRFETRARGRVGGGRASSGRCG